MTKTQPIQTTIIETATIRTSKGTADLFKCWSEESLAVINLWSDSAKPSPFLTGLKVGDSVRVIAEVRNETDINGKSIRSTYYTAIPAAPQS